MLLNLAKALIHSKTKLVVLDRDRRNKTIKITLWLYLESRNAHNRYVLEIKIYPVKMKKPKHIATKLIICSLSTVSEDESGGALKSSSRSQANVGFGVVTC